MSKTKPPEPIPQALAPAEQHSGNAPAPAPHSDPLVTVRVLKRGLKLAGGIHAVGSLQPAVALSLAEALEKRGEVVVVGA